MASQFVTNDIPEPESSHSYLLSWEDDFDAKVSQETFRRRWHLSLIIPLLVYLPTIYMGQMIMRKREPFNLRVPLIFWNSALAIFSIIGFIRVVPEMFHVATELSFYHSVCDDSFIQSKETSFWFVLFVLSKIPELMDTMFLVLKKQRLLFLHVYHHASVLIFSWYVWSNGVAAARWYCTMNYGVHSIMYTYYTLKTLPNFMTIPKWISMLITALQTIQMIVGAYVASYGYYVTLTGVKCRTTTGVSCSGLFLYISYLILFSKFFYNAYCSPAVAKSIKNIDDKKRA